MRFVDLEINSVNDGVSLDQDLGEEKDMGGRLGGVIPTNESVFITDDMIPLVIAELQRIYDSKNKKNDGQPITR